MLNVEMVSSFLNMTVRALKYDNLGQEIMYDDSNFKVSFDL